MRPCGLIDLQGGRRNLQNRLAYSPRQGQRKVAGGNPAKRERPPDLRETVVTGRPGGALEERLSRHGAPPGRVTHLRSIPSGGRALRASHRLLSVAPAGAIELHANWNDDIGGSEGWIFSQPLRTED